jgi:hypothetical protein
VTLSRVSIASVVCSSGANTYRRPKVRVAVASVIVVTYCAGWRAA